MITAQNVTFSAAGEGPSLEGVLHLPEGDPPFPAAIVCHPHPLMGGDMHNTIVVAVCRELAGRGWMTLRFNFRGAGRSRGSFDEGRGERDDVAGAVDYVCAQAEADTAHLAVTGYSFGAGVGLSHAARDSRVGYLVGIALVGGRYADPFLDADSRPKLFVVGERDPWAPAERLRDYVARLSPPKSFHVIPHTDHFFGGREDKVAALIAAWLDEQRGNDGETGA